MLLTSNQLKGFAIRATDGELGIFDQLYFDDESWAVRYLIVETGGWLGGRPVLISPVSVIHADTDARCLDVALTKTQVADSPDVDTQKPVSRQHEADYLEYYGYPFYWEGPYLWGPAAFPFLLSVRSSSCGARTRQHRSRVLFQVRLPHRHA